MKWLLCKSEEYFDVEQDCSMYKPIECMQIFDTEDEADEAYVIYQSVNIEEIYIVFNSKEVYGFL